MQRILNSGPEERSSGPLAFLPCFSEGLRVGGRRGRWDGVRAESAGRVKERATRALGTTFALSSLAGGERGAESV